MDGLVCVFVWLCRMLCIRASHADVYYVKYASTTTAAEHSSVCRDGCVERSTEQSQSTVYDVTCAHRTNTHTQTHSYVVHTVNVLFVCVYECIQRRQNDTERIVGRRQSQADDICWPY